MLNVERRKKEVFPRFDDGSDWDAAIGNLLKENSSAKVAQTHTHTHTRSQDLQQLFKQTKKEIKRKHNSRFH